MSQPPNHPMPAAVRRHGKIIDPATLEMGDLILVQEKKPSWTSRRIVAAQRKQFDDKHALWSHAAVSGGRFEICEADLGGVTAKEYWDYVTGDHDVRIRRLKNASSTERSMVAYYAATSVRTSYGFANLLSLARSLADGDPWKKEFRFTNGTVCSQLYFEACMRIGILLAKIPPEHACPAHLSQSDQLIDIPVSWIAIG